MLIKLPNGTRGTLRFTQYIANEPHTVGLGLYQGGERYAVLTVNMSAASVALHKAYPDAFFVKGYSENEGLPEALVEQKAIEPVPEWHPEHAGFAMVHAYQLTGRARKALGLPKLNPQKFNESQRHEIMALVDQLGNDGHTIWLPSVLADFPRALWARFLRRHVSDPTEPKYQITTASGCAVESMTGVHGLTVLQAICDDLGLQYERTTGRGTQARHCTYAINRHFTSAARPQATTTATS